MNARFSVCIVLGLAAGCQSPDSSNAGDGTSSDIAISVDRSLEVALVTANNLQYAAPRGKTLLLVDVTLHNLSAPTAIASEFATFELTTTSRLVLTPSPQAIATMTRACTGPAVAAG